MNGLIMKRGRKNMEIEVFLFRALSIFILLAMFLYWTSTKWECVSTDVATGFMFLSFGISVIGVTGTVCDLVKWIFDRF